MPKPLVANLYNPHEQSQEQLIESFVVRHDVFYTLLRDIRSTDMTTPGQHYLIEGQRGMGKTTLLLRLSYEIEKDQDLREWLIPVVLKEEAYYGIRHLYRLWETVAQELEGKDKAFSGLVEKMSDAYEQARRLRSQEEHYEGICFEMLIQALEDEQDSSTSEEEREQNATEAMSRRVILFIDNLGEMLQNFSDQENLRLHEILTTCPYLRIISATPVVFGAIFEKEHLFSNFFTTIRLEGLNKEETRNLLLELAKVYHEEKTIQKIIQHHPGRIEALRILTGGVIRTIILLFEIFTENEDGSSVTDLDNILDRVTPLYQSRMKDLTPLQRDIVNAVALNWDAISPEEIADKTRLDINETTTVLKELEKVFIIQPVITDSQLRFYQLQERFFNIWYLMRLAPGGSRSKVLWLLHFLESWYEKHELGQLARKHTEAIVAGRYHSEDAYYLTEAFTKTGQLDMDTEHQMLHETKKLLQELDMDLAEGLPPSDKEIFEKAEKSYRKADYENAIRHFLEIKHKTDHVYIQLSNAFSKLSYYKEAIEYLLEAVEHGNVEAMLQLGLLYQDTLNDYQNAVMYYSMAVKKGSIEGMLSLGNLYYRALKDYKNAEKYYLMAVKEGRRRSTILTSEKFTLKALKSYLVTAIKGESDDPEHYHFKDFSGAKTHYLQVLKRMSAEAMFHLGSLYARELKNYEKAEMYFLAALKAGYEDAIVSLGFLYHYTLKDYKNAIKYYTMAVKKGEENYAAMNLGLLYQNELKDYKNAERYYSLAVEQGDAGAMNGLAWLYFEQKIKKREALHYAKRAFEREKNIYTAHTLACIYLWNNQPDHASQTAEEFMYDEEAYTYLEKDILLYLMLLIAQKRYQYITMYFETPELDLQERFKPLCYAFLYFTGDQNYYKLPPELSEPVEDIIKQIKQLAVDYQ
jgi:TPR repeat protein